jgi:hypothetical protein
LLASLDSLVTDIASLSPPSPQTGKTEKSSGSKRRAGGKARADRQPTVATALFDSGYRAAQRFSDYLKDRWSKFADTRQLSIANRLAEWCDFDSKVGFGRFHSRLKGDTSGSITLVNNFLTKDRTAKNPNMCEFMTGYITRVLEAVFSEGTVTVSHDLSRDCGQYQKKDRRCVFRFRVVENNELTSGR